MDTNATKCIEHLGKALSYTREGITKATPYWNKRKDIEGNEYRNAVIELKYNNGKTMYIDVDASSNAAAIYDVMNVLMGYASPINPRCIETLIPIVD